MPYRNAYLYVLLLIALTFAAFWPTYISNLPAGKIAWHTHASSAVLWTMFAALQSWSIHHGRMQLHRTAGLALFILFPYFLVGGMHAVYAETVTLAASTVRDDSAIQIAQFGFFDPLANIGFATMFYLGLKYRSKVHLHARYMLGTVMFVVAPIIWRLLQRNIEFFANNTPETTWRFSYAMAAGQAGAILIAYLFYRQAPQHGRPWLIVIGFIAAQELLFETVGRMEWWAPVFASISKANLGVLLVATAAASLAIAWHGWVAGRRPTIGGKAAVAA